MWCIIWWDSYLDSIPFHHLNLPLFHPSAKNTSNNGIILTFNFHGPVTQNPGHYTFKLNGRRFSQIHADINNVYILNQKNLRSSASKKEIPILLSYKFSKLLNLIKSPEKWADYKRKPGQEVAGLFWFSPNVHFWLSRNMVAFFLWQDHTAGVG